MLLVGTHGNLQRDLGRALNSLQLERQSSPREGACRSDTGGRDLRYDITYQGAEYVLDSCRTTVDGQGDVWVALLAVWNHFSEVGNSQ